MKNSKENFIELSGKCKYETLFYPVFLGVLLLFVAVACCHNLIEESQTFTGIWSDDFQEDFLVFSTVILILFPLLYLSIKSIIFLCQSDTCALDWDDKELVYADISKRKMLPIPWSYIDKIGIEEQLYTRKGGTTGSIDVLVLYCTKTTVRISTELFKEYWYDKTIVDTYYRQLQKSQPQIPWIRTKRDFQIKYPSRHIALVFLYLGLFIAGVLLWSKLVSLLVEIW